MGAGGGEFKARPAHALLFRSLFPSQGFYLHYTRSCVLATDGHGVERFAIEPAPDIGGSLTLHLRLIYGRYL